METYEGSIEIDADQVAIVMPLLNARTVTQDMMRLAVLFADPDQQSHIEFDRSFLQDDEDRWEKLDELSQMAANWRLVCGSDLHIRFAHEQIPHTLDEIRTLSLRLPMRAVAVNVPFVEYVVQFDDDEALIMLKSIRQTD